MARSEAGGGAGALGAEGPDAKGSESDNEGVSESSSLDTEVTRPPMDNASGAMGAGSGGETIGRVTEEERLGDPPGVMRPSGTWRRRATFRA